MTFSKIINSRQKGFTLIELLVVIGILAVLLTITLIAINPAKQFSQANNTKRTSDINAILNAINQFMADNKGSAPIEITTAVQSVSKAGADICADLVTKYLAALPSDPKTGVTRGSVADCTLAAYDTRYSVVKSAADNRITVSAMDPELDEIITVTR